MAKIHTNGRQAFNVPNTDEGRLFIKLGRQFANFDAVHMRRMGRAADRKAAYVKAGDPNGGSRYARQSRVPIAGADWFALYVFPRGMRGVGGVQRATEPLNPKVYAAPADVADTVIWGEFLKLAKRFANRSAVRTRQVGASLHVRLNPNLQTV